MCMLTGLFTEVKQQNLNNQRKQKRCQRIKIEQIIASAAIGCCQRYQLQSKGRKQYNRCCMLTGSCISGK